MSDDIYDKHVKRIAVSIFKAVSRPELLPYMKKQLLRDIVNNINNLTDQEIESHMGPLKELLSNETKKDRPL